MAAFPWMAVASLANTAADLFNKGESPADQRAAQAAADKKAYERTVEMNKNQVRWRVEDAKKAGIHPLAALGLPGAGGFGSSSMFVDGQPNSGSVVAGGVGGFAKAMAGEQVENADLQNKLLQTEIALNEQKLGARSRTLAASVNAVRPQADPTDKPLFKAGPFSLRRPPRSITAQQAEDEGWEIGGAAQGSYNILGGDWFYDDWDKWSEIRDAMGRFRGRYERNTR